MDRLLAVPRWSGRGPYEIPAGADIMRLMSSLVRLCIQREAIGSVWSYSGSRFDGRWR